MPTTKPKKPRPGNSNADLPPEQPVIPPVDEHTASDEQAPDGAIIPLEELLERESDEDAAENTETQEPVIPTDAAAELAEEIVNAAEVDAAKAAEEDYKSAKALAKYDATTRRLQMEALATVEAKESAWVAAKDIAKEAKEDMEVAERELRQLIKDRESQRGKKPQPKQTTIPYPDPSTGHNAAAPDVRSPDEVPVPEDDSWKSVPLTELVEKDGLPAKVCEKLTDCEHKERGRIAPITTVGELQEFLKPLPSGYTPRLADIKGLGPAKVEAVEEALIKFWARRKAEDAARQSRVNDDPVVSGDQPATAGGNDSPVEDGEPGASGDRDANAEPAADPAGPAVSAGDDEPAGYQTEASKRIGERLKEQQAK